MALFKKKAAKKKVLQASRVVRRKKGERRIENKKLGSTAIVHQHELVEPASPPGAQEPGQYGPKLLIEDELELRCPICDCRKVHFEGVLPGTETRVFRCGQCVVKSGSIAGHYTRFTVRPATAEDLAEAGNVPESKE